MFLLPPELFPTLDKAIWSENQICVCNPSPLIITTTHPVAAMLDFLQYITAQSHNKAIK
jgi:hypothetical protein